MAAYKLVSASDAHERVSNNSALLVCAYESEEKFHKFHLEGAIPLSEFRGRAAVLAGDQEIIFYCG